MSLAPGNPLVPTPETVAIIKAIEGSFTFKVLWLILSNLVLLIGLLNSLDMQVIQIYSDLLWLVAIIVVGMSTTIVSVFVQTRKKVTK